MSWVALEGCGKGFEMNRKGCVREIKKGQNKNWKPKMVSYRHGRFYYGFWEGKTKRTIAVRASALFFKCFGEEVDEEFFKKTREYILKRQKEQKTKIKERQGEFMRKCHDCGRPTTNYRCTECWEKILQDKDDYPRSVGSIATYNIPFRDLPV